MRQLLKDTVPQVVVDQLHVEMMEFSAIRPVLVDMSAFAQRESAEADVRAAAEVLAARLKSLRFGS